MVIGIAIGMGNYATLDIFDRLMETFPAQKEWERPRIIIDNNCTVIKKFKSMFIQGGR